MTKPKGQYDRSTKLAALAAVDRNRGSIYRASKETGISTSTLSNWMRERARLSQDNTDNQALDDRLEQLARQMVAAMPEKVDEANLQELARSLSIVLGTINLTRTEKEKKTDVREKLARLLDHYAAQRAEGGTPEPVDGG